MMTNKCLLSHTTKATKGSTLNKYIQHTHCVSKLSQCLPGNINVETKLCYVMLKNVRLCWGTSGSVIIQDNSVNLAIWAQEIHINHFVVTMTYRDLSDCMWDDTSFSPDFEPLTMSMPCFVTMTYRDLSDGRFTNVLGPRAPNEPLNCLQSKVAN